MPSLATKKASAPPSASGAAENSPTQSGQDAKPAADINDAGLVELIGLANQAVTSLQDVFSALDRSIVREFSAIAGCISQARDDIGRLQPEQLSSQRIPEAGRELAAIVESTEDATHRIMEAGERILEANENPTDANREVVETEVMNIFEACTFQDITGQRVTKVVETLQDIEERVKCVATAFGPCQEDVAPSEREQVRNSRQEEQLLHGPAHAGEGVAQDEVDAMFD